MFIRYSGVHDEPRIRVTWSIVLVMSHLLESEPAFTRNTYKKMTTATRVSTRMLYLNSYRVNSFIKCIYYKRNTVFYMLIKSIIYLFIFFQDLTSLHHYLVTTHIYTNIIEHVFTVLIILNPTMCHMNACKCFFLNSYTFIKKKNI